MGDTVRLKISPACDVEQETSTTSRTSETSEFSEQETRRTFEKIAEESASELFQFAGGVSDMLSTDASHGDTSR